MFTKKFLRSDDIFRKPGTPVFQNIGDYEKIRHFLKNKTLHKIDRRCPSLFPKNKNFVRGGRFPENPEVLFPKNFLGEK